MALQSMHTVLYNAGLVFTVEEQATLKKATSRFGQFQLLRSIADITGELLWQIATETHMVQRMPLQSPFMNPRWTQNHNEENMCGNFAKACAS